jgi:hypothetical protein
MASALSFRWALPANEALDEQALFINAGVSLGVPEDYSPPSDQKDLYSHAYFEPLMVLAGIVAIDYLWQRIEDRIKDGRYTGILIDARTSPVEITPVLSLDRGVVLVRTENGIQMLNSRQTALDAIKAAFIAALQQIKGVQS